MAYALKVWRLYSVETSNGKQTKKDHGFFLREEDIDPKLRIDNPNSMIEPVGIIVLDDDSDFLPGMRFAN